MGSPYNGIVYTMTDDTGKPLCTPIKSSLIGKRYGYERLEKRIGYNIREYKAKKWQPKIRNEVALAMHGCRGDRETFVRLLAGKGIDAVFRENNEGRIYGATFIDHKNREVYNGSRLGKEFSANAFERLFNNPDNIPDLDAPCRTPVCKADSPPIWKVPSNRLSGYSTWKRTVPIRRKRLSPGGCNVKKEEKTPLTRNFLITEFTNIKNQFIMQQEDDLRGLAKVMEFMRAISIVFIVIHVYWFCYRSFVDMGINIGVVDKILLNFQRTAGIFSNLLVTKVFAVIFLGLSCLGTKRCQEPENDLAEDIRRLPFGAGAVLHELVDARPAVQPNGERGRIYVDTCSPVTSSC